MSDLFVAPGNSNEIIFKIMVNSVDGSGVSPSARIFGAYQNSATNGFYSLNPNGIAAEMIMDEEDARYTSLYSAEDNYIYVEKYSTDQMHYQYIRLAEMYLTRAEADIMVNGCVWVLFGVVFYGCGFLMDVCGCGFGFVCRSV